MKSNDVATVPGRSSWSADQKLQIGQSVTQAIRNTDIFGYAVNLNFDHFQATRKTFFGGIVTMCLGVMVGLILLTNIMKIGQVDTALYEFNESQMNLMELGEVKLSQMSTPIFFVLHKHVKRDQPKYLHQGVDRYINISFSAVVEDWNIEDTTDLAKVFTRKTYSTVHCKPEHFGTTKRARELYDSWAGFSLFCINFDSIDSIALFDQHGEMFNKHFSFQIDRCINSTHNKDHCHSNEMIDDYISDASMHGWVIQDNLMLRDKPSHPPRYQSMRLWMVSVLGDSGVDQF